MAQHRKPTALSESIGTYSKAIVAFVGALLTLLTQLTPVLGFLPVGAQGTVSTAIAILTGISVFLVKNTPTVQTTINDARDLGLEVKKRF